MTLQMIWARSPDGGVISISGRVMTNGRGWCEQKNILHWDREGMIREKSEANAKDKQITIVRY